MIKNIKKQIEYDRILWLIIIDSVWIRMAHTILSSHVSQVWFMMDHLGIYGVSILETARFILHWRLSAAAEDG